MPDEERIFKVRIEGIAEVWLSDLDEQQDPVDFVKERLEALAFDGDVRLVDEV